MKINKQEIFYLSVAAIILLVILFFPISTDLAIFIQTGEIISKGGKPYVDFIDIKSPLIYYMVAVIYKIFGSSEMGLRLFDFLMQLITCVLLFLFVRKNNGNKMLPGISAIVYGLAYSTLSFIHTMQVESYVPLLTIIMAMLVSDDEKKNLAIRLILFGFAAGVITAMKYSMVFIVLALPLYDFLSLKHNFKDIIKRALISSTGFLIAILLSLLPFLDSGIRKGFGDVLSYIVFYAGTSAADSNFVRDSIKALARFFGDKYTLLFTLSLFIGIFNFGRLKKNDNDKLFKALVAILLPLSISIIVEHKFFEYHFSRMYGILSIFTAAGIILSYENITSFIKEQKRNYLPAMVIILFMLILSPVPKWFSLMQPTVNYFSDKNKYENYYNRPAEGGAILLAEQRATANYIKQNLKLQEKVFVVSVASSIINYYIGELAFNKFMLSCFYISTKKIDTWSAIALDELKHSQYLVMQEDDPNVFSNGHILTSRQSIQRDEILGPYANENFHQVKQIGRFYIYKRNGS